jgi:hypothetical protein
VLLTSAFLCVLCASIVKTSRDGVAIRVPAYCLHVPFGSGFGLSTTTR